MPSARYSDIMPGNLDRRISRYGQSNLSPLYVVMTCGRSSCRCFKKYCSVSRSLATLMTLKGPGKVGFGVYSKSSMSSLTISRLMMRKPWLAIMYEIMNTRSCSGLGNLSGLFSHSMSKAKTRGSHSSSRSFCHSIEHVSALWSGVTVYHAPTRTSKSMATRMAYGTSYSRMSSRQSSGSPVAAAGRLPSCCSNSDSKFDSLRRLFWFCSIFVLQDTGNSEGRDRAGRFVSDSARRGRETVAAGDAT